MLYTNLKVKIITHCLVTIVTKLIATKLKAIHVDGKDIVTTSNEIYVIRSNNIIETISNEVYGVKCNNIDMTTNEVYSGVCTDGTETIPNYVYGVRRS